MKLNRKIIIPAATLLIGFSLAGSAASTIAWYQYSTRANVSYIGSSAGTVGNLQVRIRDYNGNGGEWGTQIVTDDVLAYLAANHIGEAVEPVTPGALAKNDSLKKGKWQQAAVVSTGDVAPNDNDGVNGDFYLDTVASKLYQKAENAWEEVDNIDLEANAPDVDAASIGDKYVNTSDNKLYEKVLEEKDFYLNPNFGAGAYENWNKASAAHFVKIPLQLRFMEGDEQHLTAQNVYLSKLLIQEDRHNDDVEDHGDISDAIRVHFSAYEEGDEDNAVNHLVSKKGGTILTHGKLKIGGGSDFDKAFDEGDDWGFDGSNYDYVQYGEGLQTSYGAIEDAVNGYYYEEEAPASGWELNALTSGAVAPDDNDGADGDFYFDTAESKLYQKDNGAWAEFADYLSGSENPNLAIANPNGYNYYFKSGENKLFKRFYPTSESISPILVGPSDDASKPMKISKVTDDKKLGATIVSGNPQHYLNVDVTIWVEGWQKFEINGSLTSLWSKDLIGAQFDVGMQFAVQDLKVS